MDDNLDLDALAEEAVKGTQPESLSDTDLDVLAEAAVGSDRGPVGKAFDYATKKVGEVGEYLKPGWEKFKSGAEEMLLDIPSGHEVLHGLENISDISDRLAGTAIGTATELVNRGTGYLAGNPGGAESLNVVTKAKKDMAAQGANILDPLAWRNYLPVSLVGDIGFPLGKGALAEPGKILQKSSNRTLRETGEVMEGLSGVSGIIGGLLAGANFDPLAALRFGQLTKAGVEAEQAGKLVKGVAKSMEAGERSVVEFGLGGIGIPRATFGSTNFGKVGPRVIDKMAEAATTADVFNIPIGGGRTFTMNDLRNQARKFMTDTPLWSANEALDNYGIEKNLNVSRTKKFFENVKTKAMMLGIDVENPEVRRSLYKKFEQPSRFPMNAEEQVLHEYLTTELAKEVAETRAQGININEKKFDPGHPMLSETYVPRGADPTKLQQRVVSKLLSENEEAAELAEHLSAQQVGKGGGTPPRFIKQRKFMETREAANRIMKEKYGIEDFFHDDIVRAYGEKMSELRQARSDKRLVEKFVSEFGTSEVEYVTRIINARQTVAEARVAGLIPHPDDVFISKLRPQDMVSLRDMPPQVRARIAQVSELAKVVEDAPSIKLPGVLADHLSEAFYTPKPGFLRAQMMGVQNALKKFMFFTPGFHTRNMVENFGKAETMGAGVIPHIKAGAAIYAGKGPYVKNLESMLEVSRGMGITSAAESTAETALGRLKNEVFDIKYKDAMLKKNPMETFRGIVEEAKKTGKFENFVSQLRTKGVDHIVDNPAFRFSAMAGERGELVSKLAYFSKLTEEGYDAKTAMMKVNRIFMNYERTRAATKTASMYIPFANYMVKNLEITMKLMAQRPQGFTTFGPNGAFEKAIHTWAGFDPRKVVEYKQMFGVDDMVFLPTMPMSDAIDSEKDYLKKLIYKWHEGSAEPGSQLWMKLPSNYHALKMMDPERFDQLFGPSIHAAYTMIAGKDPYTGVPVPGAGTSVQFSERFEAGLKELTKPVVPDNLIRFMQYEMNQKFPEYEQKLLKMGLEDTAAALFGNQMDVKREEKFKKAISKMKMLWNGGATQADLAYMYALTAEVNASNKYLSDQIKAYGNGKSSSKVIDKGRDVYMGSVDKIIKGMELLEDYNKAVSEMKDVPVVNSFAPDLEPDVDGPVDEPEDDFNTDEELGASLEDASLNDMAHDATRDPQSVGGMIPQVLREKQAGLNPFRSNREPQGMTGQDLSPGQQEDLKRTRKRADDGQMQEGSIVKRAADIMRWFEEGQITKEQYLKLVELNNRDWKDAQDLSKTMESVPVEGKSGGGSAADVQRILRSPELKKQPRKEDLIPMDKKEIEDEIQQHNPDTGRDPVRNIAAAPALEQLQAGSGGPSPGGAAMSMGLAAAMASGQKKSPEMVGRGVNENVRRLVSMPPDQLREQVDSADKDLALSIQGMTIQKKNLGGYEQPFKGIASPSKASLLPGYAVIGKEGKINEHHMNENVSSWARGFAPNPDTFVIFEAQRNKADKEGYEPEALNKAIEYARKAGFKNIGIADADSVSNIQGHVATEAWVRRRYDRDFVKHLSKQLGQSPSEKSFQWKGRDDESEGALQERQKELNELLVKLGHTGNSLEEDLRNAGVKHISTLMREYTGADGEYKIPENAKPLSKKIDDFMELRDEADHLHTMLHNYSHETQPKSKKVKYRVFSLEGNK